MASKLNLLSTKHKHKKHNLSTKKDADFNSKKSFQEEDNEII